MEIAPCMLMDLVGFTVLGFLAGFFVGYVIKNVIKSG